MKHKSIFFSISLILSSFSLSSQELPKEVVWQKVEGVNVPIPPQRILGCTSVRPIYLF